MSRFDPSPLPYQARVHVPESGTYNIDVVPRGVPVLLAQSDNWFEIIYHTLMELFANPARGFVVSVLRQGPRGFFSWPKFVCFEFHSTVTAANGRARELEEAATRGELVGLNPIGWRRRRRLIRDATSNPSG